MYNQDFVAMKLMQVPIEEMHMLMYNHDHKGIGKNTWKSIIKDESTLEFLLSHGWVFADYIDECSKYITNPTNPVHLRYMCFQFIKHA